MRYLDVDWFIDLSSQVLMVAQDPHLGELF